MKYLLDSSAFYKLIQNPERSKAIIINSYVLDLTYYEVGNIIWKEYKWGKLKNFKRAIELISELLDLTTTINISTDDLGEIENLATTLDLTFYDASYVYYAKKLGLNLLTNDRKILEKAGNTAFKP